MIRPPASKTAGVWLLLTGLASIATVAIDYPFRSIGPIVGSLLIVVAAGIFGRPGKFARQLQRFVGREMMVEVFGRPLPDLHGIALRVESIESLALGLWIRLRVPSGKSVKMKIAQPTTLSAIETAADIEFAGYAQWDSRRIKGPDGRRAPGTVTLRTTS